MHFNNNTNNEQIERNYILVNFSPLFKNSPLISVSRRVSTKGLKKVEKKGFPSPNHNPPNILNLFFPLKKQNRKITIKN